MENTSLICNKINEQQIQKMSYLIELNRKNNINFVISQFEEVKQFYQSVFNNGIMTEKPEITGNKLFYNVVTNNIPHPLCFELGHVILFYINNFIKYVKDDYLILLPTDDEWCYRVLQIAKYKHLHKHNNDNEDGNNNEDDDNNDDNDDERAVENIFDSLINNPSSRETNFKYSLEFQIEMMNNVFNIIETILHHYKSGTKNNMLHVIDTYILNICYLHYEMHKEVIFFMFDQMKLSCDRFSKNSIIEIQSKNMIDHKSNPLINEWIYIDGVNTGVGFKYGFDKNNINDIKKYPNSVFWDNECPQIEKRVESFYVQKYPVTYGDYIVFIKSNGYDKKQLWSFNGWKWLKSKNITMPINIEYDITNNTWYRLHFEKKIILDLKLPVVHISYYEAEAYSKFMGATLPTEEEYTYLLTNAGTTLYPWGNDTNTKHYCNSCYTNNDVVRVDDESYEKGVNKWGVYGLLGNCWYWTKTRFYPFDGFQIDPIYDTFSYPFFFNRFVVKGSSWCVNDTLFHSYYRNAQEPDKCFHYTGIRLVKHQV